MRGSVTGSQRRSSGGALHMDENKYDPDEKEKLLSLSPSHSSSFSRRSPSGSDPPDGACSPSGSRFSVFSFAVGSSSSSGSSSAGCCPPIITSMLTYMNSTRLMVLLVLCLQNSLFTVLRRYSQGVLKETYSKHELLLVAEVIKIVFSSWMISKLNVPDGTKLMDHLKFLVKSSRKMFVLALIYGAMNILSFVSLRNISAGMFTIFAQCKILTTASFSTIILGRKYSWTKWRALIALMLGVLLFSEPIWGGGNSLLRVDPNSSAFIGVTAVVIEVTLSGFASIYFEKVIKTDPQQLGIWERNFQLALGSFPVYLAFIATDTKGSIGEGWSMLTLGLSFLGAAGGLLVALSIKYGDSILKTLATTGAIVLTGILDHIFLAGPLTPAMMIAGVQVIIAICNYTFDASPASATISTPPPLPPSSPSSAASRAAAAASSVSAPQRNDLETGKGKDDLGIGSSSVYSPMKSQTTDAPEDPNSGSGGGGGLLSRVGLRSRGSP
mmetsp:Transcript_19124/g.46187  ORF Transcript_19124/g.46187 Transcript_19124/m.46187 type:complete len:497 (-) Transcript_19124:196-1686(-)